MFELVTGEAFFPELSKLGSDQFQGFINEFALLPAISGSAVGQLFVLKRAPFGHNQEHGSLVSTV